MDSKQVWWPCYFTLDEVSDTLKSSHQSKLSQSKMHELFMTWVVARFMQWQKGSAHVIGFPSLEKCEGLKLRDLLTGEAVLNDDNFDTVVADTARRDNPFRLQVKRYTRRETPNTKDFYDFMCSKVRRYGRAPELHLVFHIMQGFKFDMPKFAKLLGNQTFQVNSITVFFETPLKQKCFLFSVYPKFTGVLWSPAPENDQNPNN